MSFLAKIFGTKNDRELKKIHPRVAAIHAWEPTLQAWTDDQLTQRIATLKVEVQKEMADRAAKKPRGEELNKDDVNAILDPHVHETFAIVREAGKRVLGMRHYDVQMIGGLTLHLGRISEMKTGEGKTLVATLPAVLNALTGGSVHVVTVNDYLATRDAEWMGRLYRFLGMQVGVVVPHQGDRIKKEAYRADITYGQNNEFGFDYLRDNMKLDLKDYAQRGHAFAIVDEVDSILIDEARTPLIISGPSEEDVDTYRKANALVPQLRKDEHYTIDEKARSVIFTEAGVTRAEQLSGVENLYEPVNIEKLHRITQALKAHTLYRRDVEYVIERNKVVIVDEHTGRLMYGRRWSDGLHGAVEAKESLNVEPETRTLATISFQNYFRMYRKLSGMTGTADTEAEEFAKIYALDVTLIPTNRGIARVDDQDLIFKTEREKFEAIAEDIKAAHQKGQPVLVGTVSVEKSEVLSNLLKKMQWTDKDGKERIGVAHQVLNAKRHKDEASIVAQAGQAGAVTIATNMAGRGTDILLGGNPEYMARQEVTRVLGGTDEQVAEYGFLMGRPDLINIKKLVERDVKDPNRLALWEAKVMEHQLDVETAQKKGETPPEWPAGLPTTLDEAKGELAMERQAFYEKAIKLYEEVLPRCEEECGTAKASVKAAGGLRIVGTERHESRRIDNQLRGRAGRQGDPGSSRFYLSMQDDLMRIFGSEKMIRIMEALGMKDGEPIEHGMVTRSIADAQKRVEGMHFDSRKQLIEYDDVMNQQRKAVYVLRRRVLDGHDVKEMVLDLVEAAVVDVVQRTCPDKTQPSEWKLPEVQKTIDDIMGVHVDLTGARDRDDIMDKAFGACSEFYEAKEKAVGPDIMRRIESFVYLNVIDEAWKQHLATMDHLREGIHLRSYGQKDPKQEYKKEGFNLFAGMMARLRDEVLDKVYKAIPREGGESELARLQQDRVRRRQKQNQTLASGGGAPSNVNVVATSAGGAPAAVRTAPVAAQPAPQGLQLPKGMAIPQAGASSVAGPSVAQSVRTTTAPQPRPAPTAMPNPRGSLAAELEEAAQEEAGGLNRAQRRKIEAQQRKTTPVKRP